MPRRQPRYKLLWLGLLIGFSSAPLIALAKDSLTGMPIVEVLDRYERDGYAFLYSSGLVSERMTFTADPLADNNDPIKRLKAALQSSGLTIQQAQSGTYLVVPFSPPRVEAIEGRVVDGETGEPLAGVLIEIGTAQTLTNTEGRFSLPVEGSFLQLSAPGYISHNISNPEVGQLLSIPLLSEPAMDEIVVVSSRYNLRSDSRTSNHVLDLELIDSLPSLGSDPLRITQHLPGMASIGVSAKPHIRGGLQDELLVLFNNVELLEPFHLRDFQNVFSTFNPSLIHSIDVYAGGFPARYGDRMSGVMDIAPAETYTSQNGELGLSLLNTSALLHGQIEDNRGDWTISARRGNLDIVTRKINSSVGTPSYSDWLAQIRYAIDPATDLDVGILGYTDDIELRDFDIDGEIANSRYDNLYLWAQLHTQWATNLTGSSLFSVGRIDHRRDGTLTDEDPDNGSAFVEDRRDFTTIAIGQTFQYVPKDDLLAEFGARLSYQRADYDYAADINTGELADTLGMGRVESRSIHTSPSGLSGGFFASVRTQPFEDMTIETGLRWDFQDFGHQGFESQVSPRFSLKYDLSPHSELRLSAGRFFQPEGIHELQVADGVQRFQDEQYSDHYIAGWHHRFGESGVSLRVEAFLKEIREPKRRFENLFNPMVLLPELASDRVAVQPSKARATGFEFSLMYEPSDTLFAWMRFSQSNVRDYLEGDWHPRTWDQGASISAGLSWTNERWTFATTVLWHDGWHTTRLPGLIDGNSPPELRRNQGTLADYFSLDLQVSRTWRWDRQTLTTFLEVTNALNRANSGGVEYDVSELEDESGFLLVPERVELMPLVPSIGVRWSF